MSGFQGGESAQTVTRKQGDVHAGQLMRDRNVGSVVVCDAERPVGVITDRDLALAVVAGAKGCCILLLVYSCVSH